VHRIILRTTRYHVYYRIHQGDVIIVAVWSAIRGSEPKLK